MYDVCMMTSRALNFAIKNMLLKVRIKTTQNEEKITEQFNNIETAPCG